MRKLLLLLVIASLPIMAWAQEEKADTTKLWTTGGSFSLTFSQVSLTNWQGGGESSIAGNTLLNAFANYKKGKVTWDNTLELGYGLTQLGNEDVRKTDDKIDFSSKYGRDAFKKWDYSAFINFRTQFNEGFDYPNDSVTISDFIAPGYAFIGLGFDRRPDDNFTVVVSPVTSKITIVNSQRLADAGAYGVEKAEFDDQGNRVKAGEKVRYELGGFIKMVYRTKIMENVQFQTKLDLYSNYLENPGNIDVNWETLLNLKVNKYISASLATHLVYDDDIDIDVDVDGDEVADKAGPRTQFKQVFGAGLSYKF